MSSLKNLWAVKWETVFGSFSSCVLTEYRRIVLPMCLPVFKAGIPHDSCRLLVIICNLLLWYVGPYTDRQKEESTCEAFRNEPARGCDSWSVVQLMISRRVCVAKTFRQFCYGPVVQFNLAASLAKKKKKMHWPPKVREISLSPQG